MLRNIAIPILISLLLSSCGGANQRVDLRFHDYRLRFTPQDSGYGISITRNGEVLYTQASPVILTVATPRTLARKGPGTYYRASYRNVEREGNSASATALVTTKGGSTLSVEDRFEISGNAVLLHRKVKVVKAGGRESGFGSVFSLREYIRHTADRREYFIPSILYKDASAVYPHAIAADLNVERMYVKETRSGLPLAMMRNTSTGYQLTLQHLHPDISAGGYPGGGPAGIVSDSVRYGSIGYTLSPHEPSVDFRYPCAEGPRSYEPVPREAKSREGWIYRFHPLRPGVEQAYTLALIPDRERDYNEAMVSAYSQAFDLEAPEIADISVDSIYAYNLDIFRSEFRQYGTGTTKAAGLPWSLDLPDGGNSEGVSFQMGFVGQQMAVGYHLYRYGLERKDEATAAKGRAIIDFWTSPAITRDYFPTVWWDPADDESAGRARPYPCFLRCMVDGMEGLLDACRTADAYGEAHPEWRAALEKVARHLVEKQNPDGSFARAYRADGSVETGGGRNTFGASKLNTPIAIRFLAKAYEYFQDPIYQTAALKAADYAYEELYAKLGKYVGGTPDNPNTVDKEAAVFALYGFNAAHDLSGDPKYLKAAEHAACCVMSWVYCYDFAIPCRDEKDKAMNPFTRGGVSGFSVISTGHSGADNFIAFVYYELYKLYVKTGEERFRTMALLVQNNSKSCTDFDGKMGYKYRAFAPEATNVADLAFRSVGKWLPWCGVANVEPIVRMKETFGESDINKLPDSLPVLRKRLKAYGCGGRKSEAAFIKTSPKRSGF